MNAAMNFEKTRKQSKIQDEDELKSLRARKGKLNKHQRGKDNWDLIETFTNKENSVRRHEDSIKFSSQRPAWEIV